MMNKRYRIYNYLGHGHVIMIKILERFRRAEIYAKYSKFDNF